MKILFAASEVYPFIKTGGLADVAGSLPKALAAEGHDVRVVLPKYASIPSYYLEKMTFDGYTYADVSWRHQYCGIFSYKSDGVTFYFLDNEQYFNRTSVYGYFDDGERFAFFSKAILDFLPSVQFKPDVIHLNDWQTAPAALFIKTTACHNPWCNSAKTVFTVHNLKYQGVFAKETLHNLLGLGWEWYNADGLEYQGAISYMKAGLNFADKITTVSPGYAEEIKTSFYGEGLDGIFRKRSYDFIGILNGIDTIAFDPSTDKALGYNYSAQDPDGKFLNKCALAYDLGLDCSIDDAMYLDAKNRWDAKSAGGDVFAEATVSCPAVSAVSTSSSGNNISPDTSNIVALAAISEVERLDALASEADEVSKNALRRAAALKVSATKCRAAAEAAKGKKCAPELREKATAAEAKASAASAASWDASSAAKQAKRNAKAARKAAEDAGYYELVSASAGTIASEREITDAEPSETIKSRPVIALISRLTDQKGIDLISSVLDEIMSTNICFVVLGTGEPKYEDMFREAMNKWPGRFYANISYNDSLARKIYAGADMLLMPSMFEPCGLSQLIAMRYGTIPIVRETGGLNDTVHSYNEYDNTGNGFSFKDFNAHDMLHTIWRAVGFYYHGNVWDTLVHRAMESDYGWTVSAQKYIEVYRWLVGNI